MLSHVFPYKNTKQCAIFFWIIGKLFHSWRTIHRESGYNVIMKDISLAEVELYQKRMECYFMYFL